MCVFLAVFFSCQPGDHYSVEMLVLPNISSGSITFAFSGVWIQVDKFGLEGCFDGVFFGRFFESCFGVFIFRPIQNFTGVTV